MPGGRPLRSLLCGFGWNAKICIVPILGRYNPEAQNAKVRYDDDPSTTTSTTATTLATTMTSTTSTTERLPRLLRLRMNDYFDYDNDFDYFLSDPKTMDSKPEAPRSDVWPQP